MATLVLVLSSFVLVVELVVNYHLLVVMVVLYPIEWRLPVKKVSFYNLHTENHFVILVYSLTFLICVLRFWWRWHISSQEEQNTWLHSSHFTLAEIDPHISHLRPSSDFTPIDKHCEKITGYYQMMNDWFNILVALMGWAFEYCSLENSITS